MEQSHCFLLIFKIAWYSSGLHGHLYDPALLRKVRGTWMAKCLMGLRAWFLIFLKIMS